MQFGIHRGQGGNRAGGGLKPSPTVSTIPAPPRPPLRPFAASCMVRPFAVRVQCFTHTEDFRKVEPYSQKPDGTEGGGNSLETNP